MCRNVPDNIVGAEPCRYAAERLYGCYVTTSLRRSALFVIDPLAAPDQTASFSPDDFFAAQEQSLFRNPDAQEHFAWHSEP